MFYSHQLLCKKGPLGQIWIAATMKANINRKKTEQIDIDDICMQILQPQVPLALRLSGILMGGVVLVFRRKVKFLQDDVNELLLKIKMAMSTPANDFIVSLPAGKSHAKYENVTISYNFDIFDDIEKPLLHPPTPEAQECDHDAVPSFHDEYIIVGEPRRDLAGDDANKDDDHVIPDRFQADIGDITLEDANPSSDDLNAFGMDIQDERFPDFDLDNGQNMDQSNFFPEMGPAGANIDNLWSPSIAIVNEPPQTDQDTECKGAPTEEEPNNSAPAEEEPNNGAPAEEEPNNGAPKQDSKYTPEGDSSDLKRKATSNSDVQESIRPPSPQPEEVAAPAAPREKKRRRRGTGQYRPILDECTEIPTKEFEEWLRQPEGIVGRQRQKNHSGTVLIQKLFQLPSTGISPNKRRALLESDWGSRLTSLWEINYGSKIPKPQDGEFPPPSPQHRELSDNTNYVVNSSRSKSDPSSGQQPPGGNFPSSSSSKIPVNVNAEPVIPQTTEKAPPPVDEPTGQIIPGRQTMMTSGSMENLHQSIPTDFREFGSVEKLRAALRTPSTGSEDTAHGSQLGLTPKFSDQIHNNTSTSGKIRSHASTPASGKLPFDIEHDPFTGSGSGRPKNPALSSPLGLGELPTNDYYPEDDMPVPNFTNKDRTTTRKNSLSQFELLEETGPSTQLHKATPKFLDNSTLKVLQHFRQSFDDKEATEDCYALDSLADGMDRSQAAKLFYEVLGKVSILLNPRFAATF